MRSKRKKDTNIRTDEQKDEKEEACFLTNHEVKAGKGVIDCGATHSLGGVPALEALAARTAAAVRRAVFMSCLLA